MKDKYHNIFNDLTASLGSFRELSHFSDTPAALVESRAWAKTVVDDAIVESGATKKLRPDARLFLHINFAYMVIMPIEEARRQDFNKRLLYTGSKPELSLPSREELADMVQSDIKNIVSQTAKDLIAAEGPHLISGNAIFRATYSLLENLKINQLKIWG